MKDKAGDVSKDLSELQKRILEELQLNSRISFRELSEKLHLSPPAIAAKIRDMESEGIIRRFTIHLDYKKLGFLLRAIVSISVPNQDVEAGTHDILMGIPQVVRYHRGTGMYDYYVEVAATSLSDLDHALTSLSRVGKTQTSITLESYERDSFCLSSACDDKKGKDTVPFPS